MKLELDEFNLVVLASDHNPSILNRDFLQIQHVVPDRWGWTVDEEKIVVTPSVATVTYQQGVSITVARSRFQITDTTSIDPTESRIPEIARAYIETLPNIRYRAVGANFSARVAAEDPVGMLRGLFFRDRDLGFEQHPLKDLGVRFAYDLDDADVQVGFDTDFPDKGDSVIAVGNFHREWDEYPSAEPAVRALRAIDEDWRSFERLVASALDFEVEQ
jgi:hypothetical protein